MPSALLVTLEETKQDPALATRGERKLLVTGLRSGREVEAAQTVWRPDLPCPVQVMGDTEFAVFNHLAKQTRHCHARATEIYLVLEGEMRIEVEGSIYRLAAGDMIVVNPGAFHEVRREGEFLCRVVTVNCGGPADRVEDRGNVGC